MTTDPKQPASSLPYYPTTVAVGDKLRLTEDVYDDGEDHHPPGYIANRGDVVIVRKVSQGGKGGERIYVSHEHITDRAFLVYQHEFERVG